MLSATASGLAGRVRRLRSAALRQHLERRLRDDYRCVPVFLSAQNIQRYYDGVSNRALWPLLHFFQAQVRYDEVEWEAYVQPISASVRSSCVRPGAMSVSGSTIIISSSYRRCSAGICPRHGLAFSCTRPSRPRNSFGFYPVATRSSRGSSART